MPTKFRSFEELGRAAQEQGQKKVNEVFEQSVKDDFDSIPEGPFRSSLPEISWISFARPISNRKTGERSSDLLNVTIFSKTDTGKDAHHTWLVKKDGTVKPAQPIPPELSEKYSQDDIALEIVGLLEKIGPSFIHLTDLDIIPAQDKGSKIEEGDGDGGGGGEGPIDPERLKFFRSLPDASFILANREKGLKGYMVVFFNNRNFIVVENEYTGNAAFIVDLPERLDMDSIKKELVTDRGGDEKRVTKKELRSAVEERYWKPISEKAKTRTQLRDLGAERIVHTPDIWQEKIKSAIEARS